MKRIHEFVNACNGEAHVNARTFALEIKARNRYFVFQPQFFCLDANGPRYTPAFSSDAVGFIGWLPYFNKRWDIATGKIPFKAYARAHGLPIPESFGSEHLPLRNVILKKTLSSFGNGLMGPFRQLDRLDGFTLAEGDFFESFVEGTIAKIWYWNATPTALELREMPSVVGDGKSSLETLLATKKNFSSKPVDQKALDQVLAYGGYTRASVPAEGERVLIDYVYMSPFIPPLLTITNALDDKNFLDSCRVQLAHIGNVLYEAIPMHIRPNTVYTVDAILDKENRFVLLEANCNPQVHPDVYPPMLRSLFMS